MTIPELNQEIRRLEPLADELWKAHKTISKPSEDAWYKVQTELDTLKEKRIAMIEQITSETAQATV